MSTDTPRALRVGHVKHNLGALMLSDPRLEVTNKFGLRNTGIHSGIPGGAKALPVPTSLLVGADGASLNRDGQ